MVCWEDRREKKGGRHKKRTGRGNNTSKLMAGRHGRDGRSRKIGGLLGGLEEEEGRQAKEKKREKE